MPEEYIYVKDDPYAGYKHHLPIYAHAYKSALFAGSVESPSFTVSQQPGLRLITIGLAVHQLIGNISRIDPMVVALVGPETIPPIMRTQKNTADLEFTIGSHKYLSTRKDNHGLLFTSNGVELARLTPAWKDSDAIRGIKFWMHSNEEIPELTAALFFSLAQCYDLPTEYGMMVSY